MTHNSYIFFGRQNISISKRTAVAGCFFFLAWLVILVIPGPALKLIVQADRQSETEFRLDNGLTVYLLPYAGSPLVTMVLAVKVGSADETPETSGLLHLLEHCLLFRQSHLVADNRLFRTISQHGLYYNARTEQDMMFFEISLPADCLELGLGLLKDVIFSFNLTEEALAQEKSVLLRELADNSRQPEKVGLARIYELAFPESGYALPVYGKEEVVRRADLTGLKNLHQKFFHPDNAALVVVGAVEPEKLRETIKPIFLDLKGGGGRSERPPLPPQFPASGPQFELRMKVSDTYILAGLPAPGYNHPDRLPMDMLSELAGQGLSPLIYQAFSGQSDLIYTARFHYFNHEQTGLIFILVTSREDRVPSVKRLLQNFLPRLAEMNYSLQDYLPDQQFLVFDFLQGGKNRFQWLSEKMTESPSVLALSLAKHLLLRDGRQPGNYLEAISRLDSSHLRQTARKYLTRSRPVWVVIKPEKQ
ncbi:MAG: insulinase family protein [Candidatus Saccharicenans sp.]|nr:insulinase family protein [Candidatus Saccharicenans sp.]